MLPRTVRLEFGVSSLAAHDARAVIRAALEQWHLHREVVDDAELAVSELVTNAVRHAGTAGVLVAALDSSGDRLHLSVTDRSTQAPRPRDARDLSEGGRGLAILTAVVDRWGVDLVPDGKRVWVEFVLARPGRYAGAGTA